MGSRRHAPRAAPSLALLLCLSGWGLGGPAEAGVLESLQEQGSASLQLLAYDTEQGLRDHSLLNPENLVARLPRGQTEVEARLDLKLTTEAVVLSLKPRTRFEWRRFAEEDARTRLEAWVNQGSVAFFPLQELVVSVGRDVLTWGPSNFRSPSNPIYFENGRNNPLRELRGVDVAQLTYSPTPELSLSALHTFGDGRGDWQWEKDEGFQALSLLKVDYTRDIYVASLNVSKRWAHERPRFGAFGQATVNDALLVYAEAGLRQGTSALYPETVGPGVGRFVPRYAGTHSLFYSALLGGGYTGESGHTLYLEYLHNNEGYRWADQARAFELAASASEALTAFPGDSALARQTLGAALNNGLALLGRHYLFLQVQNNQTGNGPLWQLRYSLNLVDGSGQASVYTEWSAWSRLSFFAVGVLNHGSNRTEFHSLLSRSLLVGLKGYAL